MTNPNNPLRKHFRQPEIYMPLPSMGKFYPVGSLDMPQNNEIPIFPMTAIDEITARTPDALFNGTAMMNIISSCVPSIKDPWSIPSVDLNALFVAIRLASYGHIMEIGSECPACGHEHEFEIDLRHILDGMGKPNYDQPLTMGDMIIRLVPLTYKQLNETNVLQFEDQKRMQSINSTDLANEEKAKMLGESLRRITEITLDLISLSIASIQTPDGNVTNQEHIKEFLYNCEKTVFERIRNYAGDLRTLTDFKPLKIKCVECEHEYLQEFSLDMSNFFVTNS